MICGTEACDDGGHGWDAELDEVACRECLGGGRHGCRTSGRVLLHNGAGGGGQEDGLACKHDDWCALAGDSDAYDELVVQNV